MIDRNKLRAQWYEVKRYTCLSTPVGNLLVWNNGDSWFAALNEESDEEFKTKEEAMSWCEDVLIEYAEKWKIFVEKVK